MEINFLHGIFPFKVNCFVHRHVYADVSMDSMGETVLQEGTVEMAQRAIKGHKVPLGLRDRKAPLD